MQAGFRVALACVMLTALACSAPPVQWSEMSYPPSPPIPPFALLSQSYPAGACPGSLRIASSGQVTYGAWWHVRRDSSAVLMAGRSVDGGRTWALTAPADTTDRSQRGCDRPAAAVYADSARPYVSFAYFMEANEGAGIFFTHTMDGQHMGSGEGVFHSPVPVLYGERPSRVSISAVGDDVAVAYEDPNAIQPLVGVALSRTTGHIFETRAEVSARDLPAVDPRVMLRGKTVTVQWWERPDSVKSGGRIAVRQGKWR